MSSSLFHAYDIRGTAAEGLDTAFAERLGRVLADLYHPRRVMVGRDMRSTSPELESALIKGLTESGADIVRIGLCSTPMMNVSMGLAEGGCDLGIMVTASHNPSQYNGFKLIDRNVLPIGEGSGMEEIRVRFESDAPFTIADQTGSIEDRSDALEAYLDHIFSIADVGDLPSTKVAIDTGNGMGGFVVPEFVKRLPNLDVIPLYWELDGAFPNHEANPIKSETLSALCSTVRDSGCAFGIAYDGDCDRIGFVDELGEPVPGDMILAILARALLRRRPESLILRDLRCSWSVADAIEEAGGRSEMCRVGHAFIKRQVREEDALFAGELSMHFYYGDLWGVESGELSALYLMRELADTKKTLSELWKPLKRFSNSGETSFSVEDVKGTVERVKNQFLAQSSSFSELDGIRMEFDVAEDGIRGPDAWWFSLRPSNTEPLVRLIVEAVDPKVMEARLKEIGKLVSGQGKLISR